jgi:hypothetical protein
MGYVLAAVTIQPDVPPENLCALFGVEQAVPSVA